MFTATAKQQLNGTSGSSAQQNDSDTEDALKEFSFLANETSSSDDPSDWNVDKLELANKMEQYKKDRTEQYKKDRQKQQQQQQQSNASLASHSLDSSGGTYSDSSSSSSSTGGGDQWSKNPRPNRQTLQAMIANLNENPSNQPDEASSTSSGVSKQTSSGGGGGSSSDTSSINTNSNLNQKMSNFSFSTGPKLFLEDDPFGNDSNLGELSRISVNNNVSLSGINDETIIDVSAFFYAVGKQGLFKRSY